MFLTGIIVTWGTYHLDRAIVYRLVAVNIFMKLMVSYVLLLSAVGIGLSILVSHRIAGPIHRFEQVLDRMAKGELNQNFSIRKNDELQEVTQKFNIALQFLRQEISKNKSDAELIGKQLEEIAEGFFKGSLKVEDLNKIGERLRELSKQVKTTNNQFTV